MPLRPSRSATAALATIALTTLAACAGDPPPPRVTEAPRSAGTATPVLDTVVTATFEAAAVAEPIASATLSTKLMGTVTAVLVQEGDTVRAGQPLVRLDARDLEAKAAQVAASIASAEAMHREAQQQAARFRALYADSAATRQQLEAVESGLARAEAGLAQARAARGELAAVQDYAVVRAPFPGIVTRRFVDPGAFAAPGAPLVAVQRGTSLRLTARVTPDLAAGLHRGDTLDATIEGRAVRATVEGVVPAATGHLATVNAIVANADGTILPGSAATLAIPTGTARALLVPAGAIVRQGDLTGVTRRSVDGDLLRWVRLGPAVGGFVRVESGLAAGDTVVVPPSATAVAQGAAAARE